MIITVQQPDWCINYDRGYVGFIHHFEPTVLSTGITHFQGHQNNYDEIRVSHALIVTGPNECIEADASGVVRANLTQYFDDHGVGIVFRAPRGYTPAMGFAITEEAGKHVGETYAYSLILAQALAKMQLGRLLNKWFANKPDAWVSKFLDKGNIAFCSMLVAECLQAIAELRGLGVLNQEARLIDVQELFDSRAVFADWKTP